MEQAANPPHGADPGAHEHTMSMARVYDYMLGGTTNYEVDRQAAHRIREVLPELPQVAWANRGFHQRAARWLADPAGGDLDQFIDIGSGLPTQQNTHEVVHAVKPDARVVYVDLDPVVEAHARDLLRGDPYAEFVTGDLREPSKLLADPGLRAVINLDEPVGLLMTAVLHFVADESDPWSLVANYVDAVAPGSYLALSHGTGENWPPATVQRIHAVYENARQPIHSRTKAEVERFFTGLDLVPPYAGAHPDVVFAGLWGAEDPTTADDDASRATYCGVARKPGSTTT